MELIFASHNVHKSKEINQIIGADFIVKSLAEISWYDEIDEFGVTLEENAQIKAREIYTKLLLDCFAEDTGLEVEALGNKPGVHTARYAGDSKDANENMNLLLENLQNTENRKARFRTVICLICKEQEILFEGILNGKIGLQKNGNNGFGYDPIFIPEGFDISLAEMDEKTKNTISHRKKAIQKMQVWLKQSQA
ncbi:MAG: RdgB/HAM1 family non-canonical purine NTP pyrophosphatase [Saprospiraceae bacterium]|nr:RdgB/HAM1 family non-canonical purine NTP pyrophosphatase [Saprospiraceae bacterium]